MSTTLPPVTLTISRTGDVPSSVECLVDPDISDTIRRKGWHLHLTRKGYVSVQIPLHHFVLGKPQDGMVVDHINGNRADNRRCNLREVTPHQNAQNCQQERKRNVTGLRGVIPIPSGRFGARGRVNGGLLTVKGTFTSAREAHAAYLRLVSDAGSLIPPEAPDVDISVLAEFPDTKPSRKRAEDLPTGVTRCGKKYRAAIRRERQIVHLGGAYRTPSDAASAVSRAVAAYVEGGMEALLACRASILQNPT